MLCERDNYVAGTKYKLLCCSALLNKASRKFCSLNKEMISTYIKRTFKYMVKLGSHRIETTLQYIHVTHFMDTNSYLYTENVK